MSDKLNENMNQQTGVPATMRAPIPNREEIKRLEAEIRLTRREVDQRLEELNRRMNPAYIKDRVIAKASNRIHGMKENFSKSASETYNRYQDLATEKYHKGKEVVVEGYDQNPLLACGLAFGAGLVFGAMFPVAKREQELLRESATRLRDSLDDQTAHFVNQTTDAVEDVTEKVKGHENIPDKGIDGQLPH